MYDSGFASTTRRLPGPIGPTRPSRTCACAFCARLNEPPMRPARRSATMKPTL